MITLDDFAGMWRLSRHIEDALAGGTARLEGYCRFDRDGEGLLCTEGGTLTVPGQASLSAERRYLWRSDPAGIAVFFDDGRFFHRFDPNAAIPRADHDCAPDAYAVRYDFSGWPLWTAEWRVKGPRKDYVSVSQFSRRRRSPEADDRPCRD
ncbi:DUF6314 family protein [Celeribacter ethanolicus]|uniref:DUF6314 domain-containing protein n=1 Tax=Celeribacter ethanolicus TaxID=1758178 RepID=A0A291GAT7_9RHOB|nr:DUF6314 family protein [Celeribacter ethanolicus]ATG47268.1 hypothetical protein CEW89_06610 [Celeribacter ethanolicus]